MGEVSPPPTLWVLDHPAHAQLLAASVRVGHPADRLVVTRRPELQAMLASAEGHLPSRPLLWVQRPVGRGVGAARRRIRALRRLNAVRRWLREARGDGAPIQRVVGVGAALEVMAAAKEGVAERWYVTDTEVNHMAHRLAFTRSTHLVLPTHWREDLDGGLLAAALARTELALHRLDGLHVHVHRVRPPDRAGPDPPPSPDAALPAGTFRILARDLAGGGVHDGGELLDASPFLERLMAVSHTEIVIQHEPAAERPRAAVDPWSLPAALLDHHAVLTQSTTLAAEAAAQNVPTLLVSRAERGYLDRVQTEGLPLFRVRTGWTHPPDRAAWAHFLGAIPSSGTVHRPPAWWPDAAAQWLKWFGSPAA